MPSTRRGFSLKQLGSEIESPFLLLTASLHPQSNWIFNKIHAIDFPSSHLCVLSRRLHEEVRAAILQFPSILLEVTPKKKEVIFPPPSKHLNAQQERCLFVSQLCPV